MDLNTDDADAEYIARLSDLDLMLSKLIKALKNADEEDVSFVEKQVRILTSLIRSTEKVSNMIHDQGEGKAPGDKNAIERSAATPEEADRLRKELERRLIRLAEQLRNKAVSELPDVG